MTENLSIIKVEDVLLATIPSDPDDETIAKLQDGILESMKKYKVKGVVMDISAVETMDSYFARAIMETAQMVSLMGGETVIAGMRPSVAITTAQLGLTLKGVHTAIDVESAMEILRKGSQEGREKK
jgi:rsbT antagonist protein RsbS